ncbi:MAG: hypothetical protein G01um101448_749 [Parcubacteria group bacterium Gr01-1014_48]|nr:MAG: hypothetical protein Greene041614_538 [Parcubacteria group bacterium Greene0416_14]TSC73481.1 MAG: hypothetical protein G01um101448_749 [Parcubacteria group bacterium Gr01-1014_48]TSD00552.1 MAG: hypothetical protein Greene101415_773 [Parcubacteria group bacterium Greene1014_15]TSD08245.1 MAG: hypothetical protein Greene07144_227 [Parcubacteria group bacterium Greene0714_4]
MDESFLKDVRGELSGLFEQREITALLQKSSVECLQMFSAHASDLKLLLGEKIGESKLKDNPDPLNMQSFLTWLQKFEQFLREHVSSVSRLQKLFQTLTVVENHGIKGWRVEALTATACSIPERYVEIPKGALGMLTGLVMIDASDVDVYDARKLAVNAERLRELLSDTSGFVITNNNKRNYWDAMKELKGDYFVASRLALQVFWDDISVREPEILNRPSHLPWIRLIQTNCSV